MQDFLNTVDQSLWAFESDVIVINTNGVYSFTDAVGNLLNVPTTLTPYTIPTPTVAQFLLAAQTTQMISLKTSCAAALVGGYPSSALGAVYTYPSAITDQINMLGSVSASMLPDLPTNWTTPFWCEDSSGNWAYQNHTAAQIQQVGADGKAWVVTNQINLATLNVQVMAATTIAAVQAIVWG